MHAELGLEPETLWGNLPGQEKGPLLEVTRTVCVFSGAFLPRRPGAL